MQSAGIQFGSSSINRENYFARTGGETLGASGQGSSCVSITQFSKSSRRCGFFVVYDCHSHAVKLLLYEKKVVVAVLAILSKLS